MAIRDFKHQNRYQLYGFTIVEMIALLIVLALFWFGYTKGAELIRYLKISNPQGEILALAIGLISGTVLVITFVFSCMGIGIYLNKRKNRGHSDKK